MTPRSATEARIHLGELIDEIGSAGEPIVVESEDQPNIVLVTPDAFERLQRKVRWDEFLVRQAELAEQFARELGDRPYPDWDRYIEEGREDR